MSLTIVVSGRSITTAPQDYEIPKICFWSQDMSTEIPVLRSFDGFELGVRKRNTETKLLGQNSINFKNNKTDLASESVNRPDFWKSEYGSSDRRTTTPKGIFSRHFLQSRGLLRETVKNKPAKSDSRSSQLEQNQREESNVHKLIKHEYSSEQIANVVQRASVINLPGIIKSQFNGKVHVTKGSWCEDSKAAMSIRRPRKKNEEMLRTFKTRADAKKIYQEMLVRTPCSKLCNSPGTVSELERSYTELPMFLEEMRRLKRNIEKDTTIDGKLYSKSTFCYILQRQIYSGNLNRAHLPIPFRKPTNTNLKHYMYSHMASHKELKKKI
ncbi:hypothetical protein CHS0354_032469 [Potamilus streckersoni]|uniref:Uncharacterized protein n=1 Tax=Potamilus streckersoni TaxID=2493646 RepID=A0AAE0SPX7_9BIVA|nr:hypothetical protein CHS0354_032469 [Potamilus streckersoni]